jgi:sucrose phosphorylase
VTAVDAPNRVQLITYPDSLGGDIPALVRVLDGEFPGLFPGGVHLLPPFPSSGDRGFAPTTYDEIDPRWGTWDDVRRLGERAPLMVDLMVNHLSARSAEFRDFQARGLDSPWSGLFIPLDQVWAGGEPSPGDLERIFLRRPRPWSTYPIGPSATPTRVWTTFGKADPSEQVDMDWRSPRFRELVAGILGRFAGRGVRFVRLDAVGYMVKRAGTACFMVQPETDELLDWLDRVAGQHGLTLLPEVHARPDVTAALAARGSLVYDFVLPYRVLEALILGDATRLAAHLAARPSRQVTMLDCHDGIPVKPDLDGLYSPVDVRRVVDVCAARGGDFSRVMARGHQDPDGFDVHQIRGTLYSLLGRDDDAYIAARAIQLFAPGVPQVYYVGLLAGENDDAASGATGDGRELNRHNFTLDEIRDARRRGVVQRLERLIRLRNAHPAFGGGFASSLTGRGRLRLAWTAGAHACAAEVDVRRPAAAVELTGPDGARQAFDL